jgi:hypothetical protein
MSYPQCQDSARKKEETKHGNINALSILRGGHQPSGLGSKWSLLWSLRGKNRGKSTPRVGGVGGAEETIGVGSGLEARDKSCVVLWGYWRLWREPVVLAFASDLLGPCLSYRFYRRWQLPFGGRWLGWHEGAVVIPTEVCSLSAPPALGPIVPIGRSHYAPWTLLLRPS